jgi:ankyrin repeat protein
MGTQARIDRHRILKSGINGFTVACKAGHLDMMKLLHDELGLNPDVPDDTGETPLHVAARAGRLELVKYLMSLPDVDRHRTVYVSGAIQAIVLRLPCWC